MERRLISVEQKTIDAVAKFSQQQNLTMSEIFERGAWFYMLFAQARKVSLTPSEVSVLRTLTHAREPLEKEHIQVGTNKTRFRALKRLELVRYIVAVDRDTYLITPEGREILREVEQTQKSLEGVE